MCQDATAKDTCVTVHIGLRSFVAVWAGQHTAPEVWRMIQNDGYFLAETGTLVPVASITTMRAR